MVGGSAMISSLKDGQKVTTAQSGQLAVQIAGGKVKVGRATVTAAEIEWPNGVIHSIDKVLHPPFSLLMCTPLSSFLNLTVLQCFITHPPVKRS